LRNIKKKFHLSRYFSQQEVADVLSVTESQLLDWQARRLVSPIIDEPGQFFYSFIDIVRLKTVELMENQGIAPVPEVLDLMERRLLDLDDRMAHRVLTIFEDRIILTQKNHFVDSRAGRVLVRLDLDELIEKLNKVVSRPPNRTADQWFEEGTRLLSAFGGSHQALAAFEEVLKLEPARADAYLNIGKIHHREHRLVDAERSFRLAVLRDPHHAEARYYLGRVMEDLNCLDEAIACYERALESDADLKPAYYRLGKACAKAQLWERALRHWNYYLLLDPDSARSDSIRRQIRDLSLMLTE